MVEEQTFIPLDGEQLQRYFQSVETAFDALSKVYRAKLINTENKDANPEGRIIAMFLESFYQTLEALRLKHIGSTDSLLIDGPGSGFPHFQQIESLEHLLAEAAAKKLSGKSSKILKREMLERMLTRQEDPVDLVPDLSERLSYEKYVENPFRRFNSGKFFQIKDNQYYYYWASYDRTSNRPLVYLMTFETTYESCFLGTEEEEKILSVIKEEGCLGSKLNSVAGNIDRRLPNVHPKVLKRIGLGPFYFGALAECAPEAISELLSFGNEGREFAMFLDHEYVFSKSQARAKGGFFAKGQIREIFAVPTHEIDLYERGVSGVMRSIILPYELQQQATLSVRSYSVDGKGDVYAIS